MVAGGHGDEVVVGVLAVELGEVRVLLAAAALALVLGVVGLLRLARPLALALLLLDGLGLPLALRRLRRLLLALGLLRLPLLVLLVLVVALVAQVPQLLSAQLVFVLVAFELRGVAVVRLGVVGLVQHGLVDPEAVAKGRGSGAAVLLRRAGRVLLGLVLVLVVLVLDGAALGLGLGLGLGERGLGC